MSEKKGTSRLFSCQFNTFTILPCRFTEEEVEEMFNSAPMDRQGNLLYADFCKTIKGSAKEED